MKKYSIPTIILLVFILTFCFTDCKRNLEVISESPTFVYLDSTGTRAHLIELQVNTADFNKSDGKKKWRFTGQDSNEPDSLFTTDVGPGDRVIWVGVSSSSDKDIVEITKIKHMHGAELLTRKTLTASNGVVVGDIVHNADSGAWGKYELEFKVKEYGKLAHDTTHIDPKLRIHK